MSLLRRLAARSALALVASSFGCAGEGIDQGDDDAEVAETTQPISGGYGDIEDTAVVGMAVTDGAGGLLRTCSGTLIAPNLMLTAQHCIASTAKFVVCDEASFGPPVDADRVMITTSTEMWSEDTVWRTARQVLAPPGDPDVCGRDLALVVLSEPVPAEEATPLEPRLDEEVASYETYSAIGYGASGHELADSGFRRRRDGLMVTCVGTSCASQGYVDGREWRGDHGICNGDSGGPAIDPEGRVMGVTSRGPMGCDDPIYGGLTSWREWIRLVGAEAASQGGYPQPGWLAAQPLEPPPQSQQMTGSCTVSAGGPSNATCLLSVAALASLLGMCRRRLRAPQKP
jgi:hypothetical protein